MNKIILYTILIIIDLSILVCVLIMGINFYLDNFYFEEAEEVINYVERVTEIVGIEETTINIEEEKEDDIVEKNVRYKLSQDERDLIERVVMAEAGGETIEGQMLIAQCILNAAESLNITIAEVIKKFDYTSKRPDPSDDVKRSVSAVFDDGEIIIDEMILYFYNPDLGESRWHETQVFVLEYGDHRFFKENVK